MSRRRSRVRPAPSGLEKHGGPGNAGGRAHYFGPENTGSPSGACLSGSPVPSPTEFLNLNARVGSWKNEPQMVQEGRPFVEGAEEPDVHSVRNMRLSREDAGRPPAPRTEATTETVARVAGAGESRTAPSRPGPSGARRARRPKYGPRVGTFPLSLPAHAFPAFVGHRGGEKRTPQAARTPKSR